MLMLAPPGTIERRYAIAHALRALVPGALTVVALKDKGGARLGKELKAFGCEVSEDGAPPSSDRVLGLAGDVFEGIEDALAEGVLRFVEDLQLWSSWGFSAGTGSTRERRLARTASASFPVPGAACISAAVSVICRVPSCLPEVQHLRFSISIGGCRDGPAHVQDPLGLSPVGSDVRGRSASSSLNFRLPRRLILLHDGGSEDRVLRASGSSAAAQMLRTGVALSPTGTCPDEAELKPLFKRVVVIAEMEATRSSRRANEQASNDPSPRQDARQSRLRLASGSPDTARSER